jgi:hypothetical protein
VQHRQLELDEAKVPGAVGHAHAARLARVVLVRDAEPAVEHPVAHRDTPGLLVPAIGGHLELGESLNLLVPEHSELHVRDLLPELVLLEHLPRPLDPHRWHELARGSERQQWGGARLNGELLNRGARAGPRRAARC